MGTVLLPKRSQSGVTRRDLARYSAVTAAGAVLGGTALSSQASAAPTAGSGVIHLIYQSNWQGANWNATAIKLCQQFMDHNFNSNPQFKGIHATVYPGGWGNATGIMADILAGVAGTPDVIHSCCTDIAVYEGQNFLVPLNPYLSAANIDPMKMFVAGHVEALSLNGTVYAIPSYEGCPTCYYRQDILDALGLRYPSPDWTYKEAVSLWSAAAALRSKTPRAGASLYVGEGQMEWLYRGFNGTEMDPTHTRCLLDSNQDIAAASWVYDLMGSGVVINRTDSQGLFQPSIGSPETVFAMSGGWTLLPAAIGLGTRVKWDIMPLPQMPAGYSTTFDNIDFYGILHTTKHLNESWELLRWITTEPNYTRFMMQVNLTGPALTSLWPEWESIVTAAAPPLRGKSLHYMQDYALSGHAYPDLYYLQGETEAANIISGWQNKITSKQATVVGAYTQAAKQVNQWLGEANTYFQQQAAAFAKIRKVPVGPSSSYAAPPEKGIGVPYTASPYIISKSGTYTLLGDGWDIYNASDNTTFACLPSTATEGEWVCRVVTVSNLTCPQPSVWCKFGLMARADLSDDCPDADVHVTGANQIEWQTRTVAGQTPTSTSQLVPAGTSNLMLPVTQKASNYLVKPLWLKLGRSGVSWSSWSSLDGKSWTPMGSAQVAEFGGCWVGIMACAHNGDFSNKGYVRATFDNLSFTPTRSIQLGNQGTPPGGGAVPKNWATM